LQQHMQNLVGIVRSEGEMLHALEILGTLRDRAERVGVAGNREYNAGWHTALDLANLLTVSEAITRAGLERRESRGAHFREDYPDKVSAFGTFNIVIRKASNGEMTVARQSIPEMPAELKKVIDENK
jgi:succinate dehydrogenase / fumarate reductase, flavoprotein subunit